MNKLVRKHISKKQKRFSLLLGLLILVIFLGIIAAFLREAYLHFTAPEPAYKTKEQAFINKLSIHAQEIQRDDHILTSITLAQAILESDWGESGLAKKANNLFGVKGRGNINVMAFKTKEYVNGKWIEVNANFKVYKSWNESLDAHAELLKHGTRWNKKKYASVLAAKDYKTAAKALQKAGYATDPNYAKKLIHVIETYGLNIYDNISDKVVADKKIDSRAKVNKGAQGIVWSVPYGLVGAQKVERVNYYAHKKLQLTRQVNTTNGKWYQFAVDQKIIGWVKADTITKK